MSQYQRLKNIIKIDYPTSHERKIYQAVVDFFDGDIIKADEFMTSPDGGFTSGQLNAIKYELQYKKTKYHQSLAL